MSDEIQSIVDQIMPVAVVDQLVLLATDEQLAEAYSRCGLNVEDAVAATRALLDLKRSLGDDR